MNSTVYMGYVMISVLLLVAVVCVFAPSAEQWLPGNRKYAMAGVLVLYSIVRFFRIQRFKKQISNETDRK